MKNFIMAVFFGLFMFGLSAAGSWFWQQKQMAMSPAAPPDAGEQKDESAAEQPEEEKTDAHEPPVPPTARRPLTDRPLNPHADEQPEPRAATHSSFTGLDDTVQLAASLRERMATVRERESQLVQRQAQVEIILRDIHEQRLAIEELRKQVNQEYVAVEEHLAAAERERSELSAQQQSLDDRVTEVDSVEKEGTKRLASVYDGMAADRAAKILEHMVNSGNMDTAVKLLGSMRERQAAKVLGEFQDTSLAAQLSEKLKGLKKPTAKPKG